MKIKIQHIKISDADKTVLRGKFIALNAYSRKDEEFKINNLSSYHKNLEKEAQNGLKARRKEGESRN